MKITKLIISILVISIVLALPTPASAQIDIDLGVPSGDPIFVVANMLPGDTETRQITVTNSGSTPHMIAVRCDEIEETKNFSQVLEFDILAGAIDIFDGTVSEFCTQANTQFDLGLVNGNDSVVYTFSAHFPAESGNEYQLARYVFDLIFQTMPKDGSLVINEVYYQVDDDHGLDCRSDRNILISGNGAGSTNFIDIRVRNSCFVVQSNQTNVSTGVGSSAGTGGNSNSGNTGGSSSTSTGNASSSVNVSFFGGYNMVFGACKSSMTKKNDEWIEIYNPTDKQISLKNWVLKDNSGIEVKITSNTKVNPGKFALIARDSSTWSHWDEPNGTKKVNLGEEFGDGLDNAGDHLYLIDPDGNAVDFTAWGDDTEIWNPAVPLVSLGSSMERLTPGFDTDAVSDWEERTPPTPGE